jgi:putative ABC transport system permease protein
MPIGTVYEQALTGDKATTAGPVRAAIGKALPGAHTVLVSGYDQNTWSIAVATPPARRCPFASDQMLSTADQRRAAADPRCDSSRDNAQAYAQFVSADPDAVAAVFGISGATLRSAVDMLNHGGVVVGDPDLVDAGRVTLNGYQVTKDDQPVVERTAPGLAVPTAAGGAVVLGPDVPAVFGAATTFGGVLATPLGPPNDRQTDALTAQLLDIGRSQPYIEQGPDHDQQVIAITLALAAGVIALGAAAIATGLAAVDGRGDLRTLGAVGATPRVRRLLALSQSGVIAGLGSVLGALAGFGAGAAVLYGLNRVHAGQWPAPPPYPIEVPWLNLLVSVLVVPLVAILGAGLLTRSRLPSERRAD